MNLKTEYNEKKLDSLHKKLQNHIYDQKKNWSSFVYSQTKGFYQGFDEIKLDGCRPTEKRFARYKIEKYLSKNQNALDIGCNCGFLTIFISRYVNHIDGVELNPYLISIGKDTQDFLKINNVDFYALSFENFETSLKYDVIFSMANDNTIDGNTKFTINEYIEKIRNLLKDYGLLMWETISPDTFDPKLFEPKLKLLKKYFTVLEERMVKSEYPINVPQRRFLVLRKN